MHSISQNSLDLRDALPLLASLVWGPPWVHLFWAHGEHNCKQCACATWASHTPSPDAPSPAQALTWEFHYSYEVLVVLKQINKQKIIIVTEDKWVASCLWLSDLCKCRILWILGLIKLILLNAWNTSLLLYEVNLAEVKKKKHKIFCWSLNDLIQIRFFLCFFFSSHVSVSLINWAGFIRFWPKWE